MVQKNEFTPAKNPDILADGTLQAPPKHNINNVRLTQPAPLSSNLVNLVSTELIDALKQAFGYKTDLEVAGYLGVDKQTIYFIKKGDRSLGPRQRLKILDRVLYRKFENRILRTLLPEYLAEAIIEIRQEQGQNWALPETLPGNPHPEDGQLLDLYKRHMELPNDEAVSQRLGIKPQSISTVRTGRARLGPLPRLRIFRDVLGEDISTIEEALESTDVLLKLIRDYTEARRRGEEVDPPDSKTASQK